MGRCLLVVFLFINCASLAYSDGSWSYNTSAHGPANWRGTCKTGEKQSPIDIKSAEATFDNGLDAFTLTNYNKTPANVTFTAKNNGHALTFAFPERVYNVSGGGLTDVYTTYQCHFHWGSNNSVGSEHTVNGKQFAAELHLVSFNTKYANLSQAINHEDGLAVLGVLIEVDNGNNSAFSFLENARNVTKSNSTEEGIPAFNLFNLLPSDKTKYFRYSGSLTTPECNEVVTWTVFNDRVNISQYQINLLRSLEQKDGSLLVNNFRPEQALNGRTIKASFNVTEREQTTASTTATAGSAPVPTQGACAISMTAGLFFSMLFAALLVC